MPKRSANADDSDDKRPSSPRKKRTPKTPRTRQISSESPSSVKEEEDGTGPASYATPKRKRIEGSAEEQSSSPSKAVLEAEQILAQYSPGTKREVKLSDLERLKATHEERRQEALLKVEKQKQMVEARRNEIFSRLAELGYSKSIIEQDGFDQLRARGRWWQLVEEPYELTEQEWERILPDLCVILDKRKQAARALRTKMGSSASSSPSRPKFRPAKLPESKLPEFSPLQNVDVDSNGDDFPVSEIRGSIKEGNNVTSSNEDASKPLPLGGSSDAPHTETIVAEEA